MINWLIIAILTHVRGALTTYSPKVGTPGWEPYRFTMTPRVQLDRFLRLRVLLFSLAHYVTLVTN